MRIKAGLNPRWVTTQRQQILDTIRLQPIQDTRKLLPAGIHAG